MSQAKKKETSDIATLLYIFGGFFFLFAIGVVLESFLGYGPTAPIYVM